MRTLRRLVLLAALSGLPMAFAQPPPAGDITLLTGTATALSRDGSLRALAKGGKVYSGELIATGADSYINLRFTDSSLMLLRPLTRFKIEAYRFPPAEPAPALPAVPAAEAPAAPAAEGATAGPVITGVSPSPLPLAVGRQAITLDGKGFKPGAKLTFIDLDRKLTYAGKWPLSISDTRILRQADFGTQASHWRVLVRNEDGSESPPFDFEVGVPPKLPPTESTVAKPAAPATSALSGRKPVIVAPETSGQPMRATLRLLKGGLRTLSGLIGKTDVDDYHLTVGSITVGIRGTHYIAVQCDEICTTDPVVQSVTPPDGDLDEALISGVYEGRILVTPKAPACPRIAMGKKAVEGCKASTGTEVVAGKYLLTLKDGRQRFLPGEPQFLRADPMPNPLQCLE